MGLSFLNFSSFFSFLSIFLVVSLILTLLSTFSLSSFFFFPFFPSVFERLSSGSSFFDFFFFWAVLSLLFKGCLSPSCVSSSSSNFIFLLSGEDSSFTTLMASLAFLSSFMICLMSQASLLLTRSLKYLPHTRLFFRRNFLKSLAVVSRSNPCLVAVSVRFLK